MFTRLCDLLFGKPADSLRVTVTEEEESDEPVILRFPSAPVFAPRSPLADPHQGPEPDVIRFPVAPLSLYQPDPDEDAAFAAAQERRGPAVAGDGEGI